MVLTSIKKIASFPREEQAKYADRQCRKNIGNHQYLSELIDKVLHHKFFGTDKDDNIILTITHIDIGNLACIYLHGPDDLQRRSENILNSLCEFIEQCQQEFHDEIEFLVEQLNEIAHAAGRYSRSVQIARAIYILDKLKEMQTLKTHDPNSGNKNA